MYSSSCHAEPYSVPELQVDADSPRRAWWKLGGPLDLQYCAAAKVQARYVEYVEVRVGSLSGCYLCNRRCWWAGADDWPCSFATRTKNIENKPVVNEKGVCVLVDSNHNV